MIKYKKYKSWYIDINQVLKTEYKENYKIFVGILASTSPRSFLKKNLNVTKKIYYDYIKDKKTFVLYFATNKKEVIKKYKLLPSYYNNILKVLIYHVLNKENVLILNGNKVNAFFNNLIGNYEYITLDYLMLKFFKYPKEYLTDFQYRKMENKVKKLFNLWKNKLELNNYSELQAIIWNYQREKEGMKIDSYLNYF